MHLAWRIGIPITTTALFLAAMLWGQPLLGRDTIDLVALPVAATATFWGLRLGLVSSIPAVAFRLATRGDGAVGELSPANLTLLAALVIAFSGLHEVLARSRARAAEIDRVRTLLAAVIANAPMSLNAFDAAGNFTLREGRGLENVGAQAGEFLGQSGPDVFRALYPSQPKIVEMLERALAGEDVSGEVEVNGRVEEAHFRSIRNSRGQLIGAIALGIDVTDRHLAAQALEHRAMHDSLTELPNRALLLDRISQEVARGRREGTQFTVAVADLDDFKELNDTRGHAAGDAALRAVAAQLRVAVRESDTVARLGGDEFALVLRSADVALARDALRRIVVSVETAAQVRMSVGSAAFPADGRDAEALLAHADAAMYAAKKARRAPHVAI
ncbi:MAG: GGDEF domain-containing protein [Chloroflexota bacterium]|nr:GGDEF domain-containing protein [Chloroflexota bacterium]